MAVRSWPSPGTLWFMFPTANLSIESLEVTKNALGFLSLRENKLYTVKNNALADKLLDYPLESQQGWLWRQGISGRGKNQMHIFNPISGHQIRLPTMDFRVFSILLSSDPCCNNDYSVVAIHYSGNPRCDRMSFYKAGGGDDTENTWTGTTAPLDQYNYADIICRNDKVFGLTEIRTLHVWDFSSASTKVVINPRKFIDRLPRRSYYKMYLVESLGEIYVVQQIVGSRNISTTGFTVSKFDYSKSKWIQIQTLPVGRAIVTKMDDSVCVSIQDFPELEENSIYFQESRFFGVYNLKEKKVRAYKYQEWGIKGQRPTLVIRNPR
ncbi:hypothetical protein FNV43_RR02350 [Rhamnella rubrinervis]|uniref:KIB1-4 beta-propeller domain-containing protein n=1 Tax=Rhamnella rubrinervis TaxID=2594499 RepID=A0A8K0HRH2_9ROSA|nr:hypothetical protein FNV43_RR02350 [Rhamnella rubrinervis]